MARGEDLVLKISADTTGVAQGLTPISKALDGLGKEADAAGKELDQLDATRIDIDTAGITAAGRALDSVEKGMRDTQQAAQRLDSTDITLSVEDQAIARARGRIDELRTQIAQNVIMGVSTKEAEKQMAALQGSVRKLTSETNVVRVDVEETGTEEALAGIEPLREGIREVSMAMGDLTNGYSGFATVAMASVPMLADLNETMVDMQARATAAGRSMGVLGRATSSVTGFIAGPWGLAVSAAVGLLSVWSLKQDEASQATKALAESIDTQAGAMDEANRQIVAKKLEEQKLLELAKTLGVSTGDLTSAVLGNAEAYDTVQAALNKVWVEENKGRNQDAGWTDRAKDVLHLETGLTDLQSTLGVTAGSQQRVAEAVGHTGDAVTDMGGAVEENLSVWDAYGKAVGDAQSELDRMIGSLDILNGRFASVQEATSGYQQAIDDLSDAVKENGKTVRNHGKELDVSTSKGRANEQMLRTTAASIATLAEARLADADASGESTAQITKDYEKQRDALYKSARQMGLSEDAAHDYVNALLKTPKELTTAVKTSGIPKAESELDALTKDRHAAIYVTAPNLDRVAQQFRNKVNQMNRYLDEVPGLSSKPQSAPPPAPAPTVFMQPRIFLDSQPIRAALRGDVQTMVSATVATATHRGRM